MRSSKKYPIKKAASKGYFSGLVLGLIDLNLILHLIQIFVSFFLQLCQEASTPNFDRDIMLFLFFSRLIARSMRCENAK